MAAPLVLDSALVYHKETQGVADAIPALSLATPGATLLSFVGVRTALFAGPPAGNNGNTHTQVMDQAYGNGFTNYSLKGFRAQGCSGGSNHQITATKSSAVTEEITAALLAVTGGAIVSQSVLARVNAGAGATLTSGTVTTTGPALLVCVCSGDGNVNATAPTQTWPGDWTVLKSVAFNSTDAPNGHVPLYLAVKTVSGAGTYSVGVQMTIDEGATFGLFALQHVGLVQSTGKKQSDSLGSGTTNYTAPANFTPGNTAIFEAAHFASASSRISGVTIGGTAAVKDIDKSDGGVVNHAEIWRATNMAGGTNVIAVTYAGGNNYISFSVEERDDLYQQSPFDQSGTAGPTSSAAPSATAAGNTAQADELAVAVFCDTAGTNWTSATPPAGYTESFEEFDGSLHEAGSGAYGELSAIATPTATFATGASMTWIAALATYKRVAIAVAQSGTAAYYRHQMHAAIAAQ